MKLVLRVQCSNKKGGDIMMTACVYCTHLFKKSIDEQDFVDVYKAYKQNVTHNNLQTLMLTNCYWHACL